MSFDSTLATRFADWNYANPILLYALVRMHKPQAVVDVGTYRGLSASWMAKGVQENNFGKVYCIDDFSLHEHVSRYGDPKAHLIGNLEALGIREWVEIIEGKSDQVVWPSAISMAYIDAWHSHNAAKHDFEKALSLGATIIALDDTENCVGPRLFAETVNLEGWSSMHFHSANGMTLFVKDELKRPVTFSQELPNNPGVDLRFMTLEEQGTHFEEATKVTGLDYGSILGQTEHDREVGT